MKTTVTAALLTLSLTACSATSAPTTTALIKPTKPKIALVLGGGGAKGFAHVGVLKVLEKNGIQPDLIVGTSAGALVGSLYASGKSASAIEDIATRVGNDELLDFTLSKQGFIEGIKLQQWVNTQVNHKKIEQLPIRFASVATDMTLKQKVVLDKGDTGLAVRASSSVPGVFILPRVQTANGNHRYADGGLVSLVPVTTAKQLGADIIIAVDVSAAPTRTNPQDIWAQLDKSLNVITDQQKSAELALADVVIRPAVGDIGTTNLVARAVTIKAGEVAANAKLKPIQQVISNYQKF